MCVYIYISEEMIKRLLLFNIKLNCFGWEKRENDGRRKKKEIVFPFHLPEFACEI